MTRLTEVVPMTCTAEGFFAPLYELLLRGGKADPVCIPLYLVVVAAGCAIMAFLVLILDICVFVVRRGSFLHYDHHIGRTLVAAVLMTVLMGGTGTSDGGDVR